MRRWWDAAGVAAGADDEDGEGDGDDENDDDEDEDEYEEGGEHVENAVDDDEERFPSHVLGRGPQTKIQ